MQITTTFPKINLKERGVQIDLRSLEEGGSLCDHHLAQVAPPRSTGVHCSALIRSIAINTGKLKLNKQGHGSRYNIDAAIDDEDFPLVMLMGMAMEDCLSRQYPSMMYHIGELELDGISMSPDGVTVPDPDEDFDWDLGSGIIEEMKFTYKSARKPIEEQWMWFSQIKAYCKALPTRFARLHVIFANGDYDYQRPGMPCMYAVYSIIFTQEEIDDNWNMLLTELEDWKRKGLVTPGMRT